MAKNDTALIVGVGASEGLGAAAARRFAREGLHVVVAGRTADKVERVAEEICASGGSAEAVVGDAAVEENAIRFIETAEAKKIPFQRMAASRATGTDTDAFAYSNGGVASALISLPFRYMHTTVETVHQDDVENVIRLIYETVLNIKEGETFSYFD